MRNDTLETKASPPRWVKIALGLLALLGVALVLLFVVRAGSTSSEPIQAGLVVDDLPFAAAQDAPRQDTATIVPPEATPVPDPPMKTDPAPTPPGKPTPLAVTIAEAGQAKLPIVVGKIDDKTVTELCHYLKQISGATFKVVAASTKVDAGFYVGQTDQLAGQLKDSKVEVPADLGVEDFILKTDGTNVFLIAKDHRGLQHGVNTFLQKLGCRWYFPGAAWEIIPRQSTISVAFDERQGPAFAQARHITIGYGLDGPSKVDFHHWQQHNRMGGSTPMGVGHVWPLDNHRKLFQEHPDWFAMIKGVRHPTKPCYSHPEVIKHAIDLGMKQAASGDMTIGLSPPDGLDFCECERCLAVSDGGKPHRGHMTLFGKKADGTTISVPSETVFNCVNQVAKAVRAKYPGARVGCYAYSAYSHPPSFKMESNVFILVATQYRRTDLSLAEQIKTFKERGCQVGIRDYFSVFQWDWDVKPPKGKLSPDKIQERFAHYHELGVRSLLAEASNNWGPRGLSYYLISQVLWDVNLDSKTVIKEFFDKSFGPAAKPMESFYHHWYGAAGFDGLDDDADGDETSDKKEEILPGEKLKEMFKDLDEATQLAKTRPDCMARIDQLRMYLHFLVLRGQSQKAMKTKNKQTIVDAVHQETAFVARLTETNMVHSRALLGKAFFRRFKNAEKFLEDVPELKSQNKGWRARGQTPTHAEIEKYWEADRASLGVMK